jgi:hypothetical protein
MGVDVDIEAVNLHLEKTAENGHRIQDNKIEYFPGASQDK